MRCLTSRMAGPQVAWQIWRVVATRSRIVEMVGYDWLMRVMQGLS